MAMLGTVRATTVINGFNFCLSGVAGFLVFQETIQPAWLGGVTLILMGIYLIQNDTDQKSKTS